MKYKKTVIVLVALLLCVFLFFILPKTPDYTLLDKEQKEQYRTTIDEKTTLLSPIIKEEEIPSHPKYYPNFYTLQKNKNYEYAIIHYSSPCNPYKIKSIKENHHEFSIEFVDTYQVYDCSGEVFVEFEVIKFSNPKNKAYNIFIDNGKLGELPIRTFEEVLKRLEEEKN